MASLTHQYLIEVQTDGDVDHDYLTGVLMKLLSSLCKADIQGTATTVNTVVYETSYPTPKPEDC